MSQEAATQSSLRTACPGTSGPRFPARCPALAEPTAGPRVSEGCTLGPPNATAFSCVLLFFLFICLEEANDA